MEDRVLMATFLVTNTGDNGGINPAPNDGTGTLRQAIVDANSNPGHDAIRFNLPGGSAIVPNAGLPIITDPVTIDGGSRVALNGSSAGVGVDGLVLFPEATGSSIRDLSISGFSRNGLLIFGSRIVVQGNSIAGNGDNGIYISGAYNSIGGFESGAGNVISGNGSEGVFVIGTGAQGNTLLRNRIGTDAGGAVADGNGKNGVLIWDGIDSLVEDNLISGNESSGLFLLGADRSRVRDNRIGTDAAGGERLGNGGDGVRMSDASEVVLERNLVSGNEGIGVSLFGPAPLGSLIRDNLVGTDRSGTQVIGNSGQGMLLIGPNNQVLYNIVSGNGSHGIDLASNGNLLLGNKVGVDETGLVALGNDGDGIRVSAGDFNTVGAANPLSDRNVVSGNAGTGIALYEGSASNEVVANRVGTDERGGAALPNDRGIFVDGPENTIGGLVGTGAGNLVSGNRTKGIELGPDGHRNRVVGNTVGVDLLGQSALGNGGDGIQVNGGDNNTIGGSTGGVLRSDRNHVAGNGYSGIAVLRGSSGNLVDGNIIGTDSEGDNPLGNGNGVFVSGPDNSIGGGADGVGNLISGNRDHGIQVVGDGHRTLIRGNLIGLDLDGRIPLGNGRDGIQVSAVDAVTIGGTDPFFRDRNVISASGLSGIAFVNNAGSGLVIGNYLGTDDAGSTAFDPGNGTGIFIDGPGTTIGGSAEREGNVIAASRGDGIWLIDRAARTVIQGNRIGIDDFGGGPSQGNGRHGVHAQRTSDISIGGTAVGAGNEISNNTNNGILLESLSSSVVQGNFLGVDDLAGAPVSGNQGDGITLIDARANTIGGTTREARNVIAASGISGLALFGGASANLVQGNFIGTDKDGSAALPNNRGIYLDGPGNTIGGTEPGAGNLISGNTAYGLWILPSGHRNLIQGNLIGTDAVGASALGNGFDGIQIRGGDANTIGGTADGAANVIAASGFSGISIVTGAVSNVIQGNFSGTDATGTRALGNTNGVYLDAPDNTLGGTEAGAGNILSGNRRQGITIVEGGGRTAILGNRIGTTPSGDPLPNREGGISISGGVANTIGGDAEGASNVIRSNGGAGVSVLEGRANAILRNEIDANDGLGIDLGGDGIDPIDPGDGDDGPNDRQNAPMLLHARPGGSTRLVGELRSVPGDLFRIDVYASPSADPSGSGEGARHIGTFDVVDRGSGRVGFDAFVGSTSTDEWITATATDQDGNTSEFSNSIRPDGTPPQIAGAGPILDPRNRPLDEFRVEFSEPVDPLTFDRSAFILTLDGDIAPYNPDELTATLLSPTTVLIGGFAGTLAPTSYGRYILTINGRVFSDHAGNRGFGSQQLSWLMDTAAPESAVDRLPRRAEGLSFEVSVSGADVPLEPGDEVSGIDFFEIYASVDGSPFALWTTVEPDEPHATFQGQSDRLYRFSSVAVDRAGNRELARIGRQFAYTYVPDLTPPETRVTLLDATTPTFLFAVSGTDAGGSGLSSFQIYLELDGGDPQLIAILPAGAPDASGVSTQTFSYRAPIDGVEHAYRFYSVGIDGQTGSGGNAESSPTDPSLDVALRARFDPPPVLTLDGFDVQRGMTQRSYVRHLELAFSRPGGDLDALAASIADDDTSNDRIRLIRRELDGSGGEARTLAGLVTVTGASLSINFGPGGIGGDPRGPAGDGVYEVQLDVDGDGTFETSRRFFRLLGDATGDGRVGQDDLAAIRSRLGVVGESLEQDVDGDGRVSILDLVLAYRSLGRRVGDGLEFDD